jgi:hypothetical protein
MVCVVWGERGEQLDEDEGVELIIFLLPLLCVCSGLGRVCLIIACGDSSGRLWRSGQPHSSTFRTRLLLLLLLLLLLRRRRRLRLRLFPLPLPVGRAGGARRWPAVWRRCCGAGALGAALRRRRRCKRRGLLSFRRRGRRRRRLGLRSEVVRYALPRRVRRAAGGGIQAPLLLCG